MIEGTIVAIVAEKGFGFAKVPGYQNDVFFHANSLIDLEFNERLIEQRVMVEVVGTHKGPRAERVEAAKD